MTSFNAMKVKYAAQIFSDSMSVALLVLKHLGVLDNGSEQTSISVKDMDSLFDCLNSLKLDEDNIKLRYAMTEHSPHTKILEEMKQAFQDCKFIGAKRPACLKGWQITIASVLQLAEELRNSHGVPKSLTRNLNQDSLENLFAIVRQQHGCCKNPNVQQFENGLHHNYITTITKLSCNSNCEADFTTSLSILSDLSKKHKEELKQPQKADISTTTVPSSDSNIPELLENISLTDDNAIYYVSGYVSKKFLKLHACDECRNILLDKAKLLTGEHQLFTYFKQSDQLEPHQGLLFVSDETFQFLKIVEAVHNEYFSKLLKSISLTEDLLKIIKQILHDHNFSFNLCSEDSTELFLQTFVKIRNHWATRIENKSKIKKVVNKNQKLQNVCHE
ncbi:hypothetical protein ILUMI_18184 [Ignelater luminosus]|uniref:Transposable element P transposase n=1 Tax=Ignelater luminosus TaxID=2038154 RepID=A0A8K0CP35_IGNLU|nr:hypothetical protein ILUMI_18184 [Ignelater luminosus]